MIDEPNFHKRRSFKELLSYKQYLKILPYVAFMFYGIIMPQIILPAYGAKWIANCSDNDNECEYDYIQFNFYNSIFISCRGAFAFAFSAFIGMLSDSFGRKIMLCLQAITAAVTSTMMVFNSGMWVLWGFSTFYGIFSGGAQAISPVTFAYISDVLPQKLKTIGFGFAIAVMAGVSLLSAISATVYSIIWSDAAVWIICSIFRIIALLYLIFLLEESLPISNRKELKVSNIKYINPFKPLYHLNDNPLILWISICAFLNASPGSSPVELVYFGDQMGLNDENESNIINTISLSVIAVSGMISAGILLPFLKRFKTFRDDDNGNLNLAILGVIGNIINQISFSFVSYFRDNYNACLLLIIFGASFGGLKVLFTASVRGILTKYIDSNQHGIAIGILQSCVSLTIVYGPFTFGYSYNLSKDELNFPSLIFYIWIGLLLICLWIFIFPLRSLINKLKGTNTIYSFKYDDKEEEKEEELLSIANSPPNSDGDTSGYLSFEDNGIK